MKPGSKRAVVKKKKLQGRVFEAAVLLAQARTTQQPAQKPGARKSTMLKVTEQW